MSPGLKRRTLTALLWSGLQNWAGKFLTLGLFLVLARLLTPEELGLAAAAMLAVAFAVIVAEQGYPEAIIQRKELADTDLNLPFAVSMAAAAVSSLLLLTFAGPIAQGIGAESAAPLVALAAVIPPFSALAVFQTATRKRALDFKTPAKAVLLATVLSGVIGIWMALEGQGAASVVVQAAALALLSALFLWVRPVWRPTLTFDRPAFRSLTRYSRSAFASRILDFIAVRLVEFIILIRVGAVGLGLYSVGSKLYLTLVQLLAGMVTEVALAALSRISDDAERLRSGFLKFVHVAACTTLPLFVGVAAVSQELCTVLFGERWAGVAEIAMYLCLLGAVQSVQFFSGSVIGALGRAEILLRINIAKSLLAAVALTFAPAGSVLQLTIAFVVSQLVATPITVGSSLRVSATPFRKYVMSILPGLVASAAGFGTVAWARSLEIVAPLTAVMALVLLLSVYAVTTAALIMVFAGKSLWVELKSIRSPSLGG